MTAWIALLRGINVGGHNRLPMRDLKDLFAAEGCTNLTTYIQSGNVVFDASLDSEAAFTNRVSDAIERRHGFRPAVRVLCVSALEKAIADNPYPDATSDPKSLHVYFLPREPATPEVDAARALLSATESCQLVSGFLYLHAPDGVGRSKFVKHVDKALGMATTARNWRTVTKLAELASR